MNSVDVISYILDVADIRTAVNLSVAVACTRSPRIPTNYSLIALASAAKYEKSYESDHKKLAVDYRLSISPQLTNYYSPDADISMIPHKTGKNGVYRFRLFNKLTMYAWGSLYDGKPIGPYCSENSVSICHGGIIVGASKKHYVTLNRPLGII